jgi:hypothetical protein
MECYRIGCTPDGEVTFYNSDINEASGDKSLLEFYAELYEMAGKEPLCFFGLTQYTQLDGIAISKAAIYGEWLGGPARDDYFTQPEFHLVDEIALTAGCLANYSDVEDEEVLRKLKKLLYVDPSDPEAGKSLVTHSHSVSLKDCRLAVEDIKAEDVTGAYHMISNATFSYMRAKVFKIGRNERFVEL